VFVVAAGLRRAGARDDIYVLAERLIRLGLVPAAIPKRATGFGARRTRSPSGRTDAGIGLAIVAAARQVFEMSDLFLPAKPPASRSGATSCREADAGVNRRIRSTRNPDFAEERKAGVVRMLRQQAEAGSTPNC
jgi:hypothetical protein